MAEQWVLIDPEVLQTELEQAFDPHTAATLLGVLNKVARQMRDASISREDFLELSRIVQALAEAQRRTEDHLEILTQRVDALAEAQRRTEERVDALAEAQRRTEERLEALTQRVDILTQRVDDLTQRLDVLTQRVDVLTQRVDDLTQRLDALIQRVDALAEAQQRMEERLGRVEVGLIELKQAQQRTDDKVAKLEGKALEQDYRDKAGAYFGRLMRRVRVVSQETLADFLEDYLSPEEIEDALRIDLVVKGRPRIFSEPEEVWLAIEASVVVDAHDVTRAVRRASLIQKSGQRTLAVVAGERATEGAAAAAQEQKVVMLRNGTIRFWEEAIA